MSATDLRPSTETRPGDGDRGDRRDPSDPTGAGRRRAGDASWRAAFTGRRLADGAPWLLVVALATLLFVQFRGGVHSAYAGFGYLVILLLASSRLGRAWGVALAIICFLCFNFFLLRPYNTLRVRDPVDWLVLLAFLVTGIVAAELLDRAQREAAAARARAEEVDRLSTLGAETLQAGRAEDGVQAIAEVLRDRLGLVSCEIFRWSASPPAVRQLAAAGTSGSPSDDDLTAIAECAAAGVVAVDEGRGGMRLTPSLTLAEALARYGGARSLMVPLRARGHAVGVLRAIGAEHGLHLDAPGLRFAEALSYYAALGVERVRLVAEAAHADALREADRLKDALLASVSHDLRTPLTTIKALAHEMRQDGDARAAVVEEESDRLNRFVTNLLDLSRLNSGALTVVPELVPADELLGTALDQAAAACASCDVRARVPAGDDLLIGRFDPVLAVRALVNLIENACKYAAAAPIEVEVRRQGDALAFSVADRGPGVPASERERIFQPFYRGAGADERGRRPGAGLGLSIARRLAEAQGGALTFQPRPGGGSIFELRLPADPESTPAA